VEFCIDLILEVDREQSAQARAEGNPVCIEERPTLHLRRLVQLTCHTEYGWFRKLALHEQMFEATEMIVSPTTVYAAQTLWEASERLRVLYRGCAECAERASLGQCDACHLFVVVPTQAASLRTQDRHPNSFAQFYCERTLFNRHARQVSEAVAPDDLDALLGLAIRRSRSEATACLFEYARARRFELADFVNQPRGQPLLHIAARSQNTSIMRLLINANAQLDARDNEGSAALHWACVKNAVASASVLLEARCDVNARDASGRTALHLASCLHADTMVALLLRFGGSVFSADNDGNTPLHRAAISRNRVSVRPGPHANPALAQCKRGQSVVLGNQAKLAAGREVACAWRRRVGVEWRRPERVGYRAKTWRRW
jgi:hypothetical protein